MAGLTRALLYMTAVPKEIDVRLCDAVNDGNGSGPEVRRWSGPVIFRLTAYFRVLRP